MVQQPESAVVVGVDGSDKDGRAVDWAADEAAGAGTALHILYTFPALPDGTVSTSDVDELGARITEQSLARARARHPDLEVTTETLLDDPASALVRASHSASVVVVGARGLGRIAGRLLGSVSQKVAAHAQGVVVVVREVAGALDGPVVVGVDPVDTPPQMLEYAFAQATRRAVGVRMVHTPAPRGAGLDDHQVERALGELAEQESQQLARLAESWAERYPEVAVEAKQLPGHPVEVLAEESAGASLLVVGSRGRKGLTGVRLGSVARGVLHEVPVAALVRVQPNS